MNNKDKYSEVFSPSYFIHEIIDDTLKIMGNDFFFNKKNIFEIGAGKGVFYDTLVLNRQLISNKTTYVMNEINCEHEECLNKLIHKRQKQRQIKHKISCYDELFIQNFFQLQSMPAYKKKYNTTCNYDFIWGNLPFHNNGKSFVPGLAKAHGNNKEVTKPKNIKTVWPLIIHELFQNYLQIGGYFLGIIPCIWLKQDKAKIYDLFVKQNQLCFLKIFNCVQANSIFGYHCQTPICYVMVKKMDYKILQEDRPCNFQLFDFCVNDYINFNLYPNNCIPTNYGTLFQKSMDYIIKKRQNGTTSVNTCFDKILKISTLKNGVIKNAVYHFNRYNKNSHGSLEDFIIPQDKKNTLFKSITGSSFDNKTNKLILHGVISSVCGIYYNKPKLVLPHKRLLKIFKDYDGSYGCYGRDMYVFICPNGKPQIDALESWLMMDNHRKMIESGFTIRMNFIEKYVFQYIQYIDNNIEFV